MEVVTKFEAGRLVKKALDRLQYLLVLEDL
jgi:hypothetical protein